MDIKITVYMYNCMYEFCTQSKAAKSQPVNKKCYMTPVAYKKLPKKLIWKSKLQKRCT